MIFNLRDFFINNKWVILDRDGTLCKKLHYLTSAEQIEILPGVVEGLHKLTENNFRFIIITNQSPVGRNLITLDQLNKINNHLVEIFNNQGIKIEKVYSCPHTPEDNCFCRKPNIDLILKAQFEFDLNKSSTALIGDSDSDIQAGKNWGCRTIRLNSSRLDEVKSDFDAIDFLDAASYLLNSNSI